MGQIEDGGPSVTARRVAAHRLGFTRVPAAYGDPAADEALAADVVLESVLGQFRQVAAPGSRLAISVSLSGKGDDRTRARFQTAVAALGKPARSALEAGEAETLLAPPTTERPARAAANGPGWCRWRCGELHAARHSVGERIQ